jgi:hypothetical protein
VLTTSHQAGFGRLPEEVAADYFRQAVAGLEYLHFHKVSGWVVAPQGGEDKKSLIVCMQ